ncbi:chromosome alignment-maintaining phosphoprotein 1 [Crotalus tigris]|uniref:chromosome alignment-maintaining phosphoprotein 1 n=1 Tax=Crotalus tigris TaxID=88082 RepID=UPI00192F2E61|nr:chromosome alignment-maintaining phosphoprotein 1 [Crotalus tigris]
MCSVVQSDSRKMDMLKILHKTTESLECDHCNFRGSDYENIQIHMGTIHPEFCDEMDTAGLGKLIFYQKSAKLFHCHKCFFTSKMYCNVYYHITAQHSLPEKQKEDQKGMLETESLKKPVFVEPQKPSQSPETQKCTVSPDSQKPAPPELLKSDVGLHSKTQKPTSATSIEYQKFVSVACLETQKTTIVPELPNPIPLVSSETLKPPLSVTPEPLKPASLETAEIPKSLPALSSEQQKPVAPTYIETQKSLPVVESENPAEPQKPIQPVSPEAQKSAHPASPPLGMSETQKFVPSLSPEPRRHSPTLSPEPRRHSPTLSPEPRRHSPAVSPEPRRHSPAVSPELKKPIAGLSTESRRHISQIRRPASALSPEPRKPDPPLSPDPWRPVPETWRSAGSISHEQQKSINISPWSSKPPTSMSLEPRKPASEPRRPGNMMSSESQKFMPDTWKSTSMPESPKSSLASSEPWKPISSVYPEGWKPVLSPDTWRPSPSVAPPAPPPMPAELRKPGPPMPSDIWKQPFFSEQRKPPPPPVSPDPWKFSSESRKSPFFPETQKPATFVSSELQKRALFSESRKRALFPEPKKSVPSVSTETQKRSFFHEAHIPFPETPKQVVFSESHRPTPVSPDVAKHSFFPDSQKHAAVSPEIQEHFPSFSDSQKPPSLSHELLKSPAVSLEIQKHGTFAELQKTSPDSLEKQSFFAEPAKHSLSPEVQKSISSDQKPVQNTDIHKPVELTGVEVHKTINDFSQPSAPVFSDLQTHNESSNQDFSTEHPEGENSFSSLLIPKEESIQPKEPTEEIYTCPKKKAKKENPEISNTDLNSSESGNTEIETSDVKEQESNSDQEQFDTESPDQNKETKSDVSSTQPQCVLQFTEEKEAFISEEEIAKYMKRGKGKYYCKICCCRAMKKGAVLHHLVNKHNVHSPYKCDVCGKAFLLESHLKNHVASHSQSLLKCPRCSFESNFPRGFKKHLTHCQSRHSEEVIKKQLDISSEPTNQNQQSEEAGKVPEENAEPSKEFLNELQTE